MSEQMAEPDTRERNPKVQMAWGLLAPYIASADPPDLSDDDQAEILTAGALPQVWEIILELEQQVEGLGTKLTMCEMALRVSHIPLPPYETVLPEEA